MNSTASHLHWGGGLYEASLTKTLWDLMSCYFPAAPAFVVATEFAVIDSTLQMSQPGLIYPQITDK